MNSVSSSTVLMGNGCAITSTNEKVTRSSTVIKSISFDKTAEKGDRVNSSTLRLYSDMFYNNFNFYCYLCRMKIKVNFVMYSRISNCLLSKTVEAEMLRVHGKTLELVFNNEL